MGGLLFRFDFCCFFFFQIFNGFFHQPVPEKSYQRFIQGFSGKNQIIAFAAQEGFFKEPSQSSAFQVLLNHLQAAKRDPLPVDGRMDQQVRVLKNGSPFEPDLISTGMAEPGFPFFITETISVNSLISFNL